MFFYGVVMKKIMKYFTPFEWLLWTTSALLVIVSFLVFEGDNILVLLASLVGVTFLIFLAKGNPIGQVLTIVFSVLYGCISYSFSYYGEMVTYLGMTMPMAFISLLSWLRHPHQGNRAEVEVNDLTKSGIVAMSALTIIVTVVFYFILRWFHTAMLVMSTLSVTTSFLAVYLTFRRSHYYALAYAVNDLVLIILWSYATMQQRSYASVLVCFVVFFFNDVYGFVSWRRMKQRQRRERATSLCGDNNFVSGGCL